MSSTSYKSCVLGHDFEDELLKTADYAPGLPDKQDFGDLTKLPANQFLDFVIQQHAADRAGEHRDIRFGNPELGLFSWATRKNLPAPGEHIALFQQPVHKYDYKDFEGDIAEGYGKGKVRKERAGKILLTKVSPDKISFTTADERYPQRYVLIKTPQGWLFRNTTPYKPLNYQKVRYTKVPRQELYTALQKLTEGMSVQPKVDGASSLIQLKPHGLEVLSYRTSKLTGRPILHTEKVFHTRPQLEIPKELIGTVLKGELYGQQDNRILHPAELGGILNSALEKSINTQKTNNIKLKNLLYDVQQVGKQKLDLQQIPYETRREWLNKILKYLPADTFHLPEEAKDFPAAQKMWEAISSGKHPLTSEGVVVHPKTGKPFKTKLFDDYDVYIRKIFPGEGKYKGVGAGGFEYSLEPNGPIVGRVGTGFSDEMRKQMLENPELWLDRVARVRSQEKLNSGALRAPAFYSFHEDYPTLQQLQEIKGKSDKKDYASKTHKLKQLLAKHKDQWKITNDKGLYSLEHVPTGYKFHLPRNKMASLFWDAAKIEPVYYDQDQSIIKNVLGQIARIQARGQRMAIEQEGAFGVKATLNPQLRRQRFLDVLRKKPPKLTKVDELFLHFPIQEFKQSPFMS